MAVFPICPIFNIMPIRPELIEKFEPEKYYHIVCKAITGKRLFHSEDNKYFFLKRYKLFVAPFVRTLAYHLLDNHVHLIIKTFSVETIVTQIQALPADMVTKTQQRFLQSSQREIVYHELIEQQFNRLFISYVRSLNIQLKTRGHLFDRPFKRVAIKSEAHLLQAIIYVHANEVKHGLRKNFTQSTHSSYTIILKNDNDWVDYKHVLDVFGSLGEFQQMHFEQVAWFYKQGWPNSKLE